MIRRSGFEVDGVEYEAAIDTSHELPRVTLRRAAMHPGTWFEVARCLWLGDRLSPSTAIPRNVMGSLLEVVRTEVRS